MKLKSARLLIHHHAVAFVDSDGAIWLPSFIARWIDALAPYVAEIKLLMARTNQKSPRQDEKVLEPNVTLVDLYCTDTQKPLTFLYRAYQVAHACRTTEGDILLIRGITPRQMLVWSQVAVPKGRKAFILVGSLLENQAVYNNGIQRIYKFLIGLIRPQQIRFMASQETLMVANSPGLVDEITAFTRKKAIFVPTSSIREAEFSPLEVRPLSSPLKLLFVGRVTRDKGIIELIQALSLPAALTWTLDIVGPVSELEKDIIEALASATNTTDRIRWHGKVEYGSELFSWYRRADILIVPSYHEGFPHVIWEAASQSCPVIATAVGGIPALWKHEVHGLLIPSKNPLAITEAIGRLINDEVLRADIIKQAYAHAQSFTIEACGAALMRTLEQVWCQS